MCYYNESSVFYRPKISGFSHVLLDSFLMNEHFWKAACLWRDGVGLVFMSEIRMTSMPILLKTVKI
jgi:hypothetical protein